MSLKIATWNINSVNMRREHLSDFVQHEKPDILLLQEIKCEKYKFPISVVENGHYNCYINGQKSYNGVAILSKYRADDGEGDIKYSFPNNPCPDQARFLEVTINTPLGFCRIISLYAPNGGEVDSEKFKMKLAFYEAFISYIEETKTADENLIIGGDFNIAPYEIDLYSVDELQNTTCCTLVEQKYMRQLLNMGLEDLYRLKHPENQESFRQEFSWWDYRAGAFEQNKGLRIDFLLASAKIANFTFNCTMHYNMRAKPKPSDHVPVSAVFLNSLDI